MDVKRYTIQRIRTGAPDWRTAQPLEISFFFAHSSDHRPHSLARVLYDDDQLYVRFDVTDCYVRALAKNYQDPVSKDSCVELFIHPKPESHYFNFEINAGGIMLLKCVPIAADGTAKLDQRQLVPFDLVKRMEIRHSLPSYVDPEITKPCEWTVEYNIPFTLFEQYGLMTRPLPGHVWRGNFYKCADATSHPHWGMWAPIPDGINFHRPDCFGDLVFGA